MSRTQIKEKAKALILMNNLWLAIGLPIFLLTGLSTLLNTNDNAPRFIISLTGILTALWELGIAAYLSAVIHGQEPVANGFVDQLKVIFNHIKWETVQTYIWTLVFIFLWTLIPVTAMFLCLLNPLPSHPVSVGWIFICISLMIAGFVIVVVKGYSYFLAIYLTVTGIAYGKEAVTMSNKLMQGHKGDLFVLNLSFILWILLSAVTFGLAMVFVTPYILTSEAIYAVAVLDKRKS